MTARAPAARVITVNAGSVSSAYTLNALGLTEVWLTLTLTGNATLTISNLAAGALVRVFATQDATGGRALTVSNGTISTPIAVSSVGGADTAVDVLSPDGIELVISGSGSNYAPTTQTASYTLAYGDQVVAINSASATTVTVPTDGGASFSVGDTVTVVQRGYGTVTLAAANGVTLNPPNRSISHRYGTVTFRKRAANDWIVTGDLGSTLAWAVLRDVPNLLAYYKADDLALADGTAVATWTDSSGNGYSLTQPTGANQPIYKTNIVNGHAVVRFDRAVPQYVAHATLPATGKSTIYLVCKETTRITGATQVLVGRASSSEGKITISSGGTFFPGGAGDTTQPVPNPVGFFAGHAVFNGPNSIAAVSTGQAVVSENITVAQVGLTVGADFSGGNPFGGDVEEVIVCNAAHDGDTRRKVVEGLMAAINY